MAAAALAPPLQPITVTIPQVQDEFIYIPLDARSTLVISTPCLLWEEVPQAGAAVAQVRAPTWKVLRAFVSRCSLANDPLSIQMAQSTDLFQFVLTAAAWGRILTELRDSGLFDVVFPKLRLLYRALASLQIQNPALLVISSTDLIAVQPFAPAPVAPAAVVGRGRGRGRGAPQIGVPLPAGAVVGPAELRFLHLASLDKLIDLSSRQPCLSIAILAGALGPISTQAVRADELSMVRTTAAMLRLNLATYVGDASMASNAASDPLLATRLRFFVIAAFQALGGAFLSPTADAFLLQQEAMASFRYLMGSDSEKVAVEAQGMHLIDDE